MCFQELHDMFLQFQYLLWPQNLPLVRLIVFLIPSGVHCLHLWWKPSFVVKIGSVLHRLQSAFVLPWMMLKSLKSLMQVWQLFINSKKWLSISLFIKKNPACLLLLKKNWMSWILGIFIVLLYKWLLCFFFIFFVFRTREWCCINVRTWHVHTKTYWSWWLKIILCSLDGWYLCGYVHFLICIVVHFWYVHFWYVHFLLLDTSRQWPTYRYGLLFWALTVAYT